MSRNIGICEKDRIGNRKHEYVETRDGSGRILVACKKCGSWPIKKSWNSKITQK